MIEDMENTKWSLWETIDIYWYRWVWGPVTDFIGHLKLFPKNVWKWRKILWNDRDWDYYYILESLRFKIEKTANAIEKGFWATEQSSRHVRRMRVCVKLLERILEDAKLNCSEHLK